MTPRETTPRRNTGPLKPVSMKNAWRQSSTAATKKPQTAMERRNTRTPLRTLPNVPSPS